MCLNSNCNDNPSDLPDPNLQVEHLVLTIDPGQERAVGIHQAAHMNCPSSPSASGPHGSVSSKYAP